MPTYSGTSGNDSMTGSTSNDTMDGGSGNDVLYGGDGNDSLQGGSQKDTLYGGNGADTLDGGSENDTLVGGTGADSLIGGAGIDMADYSASDAGVTVNIVTGAASGGHASGDTLTGIEDLTGSAYSDTLTGDSARNVLYGGAGNDQIFGGGGDDDFFGGAGNDSVYAGSGNDIIDAGDGSDSIWFGLGNDVIYAGGGNDYVDDQDGTWLVGDQTIYGGAGNDYLRHGDGNDVVYGGDGNDTINATSVGTVYGASTVYGDAGDDSVAGTAGTNKLYGGDDNDTITGDAGSDTVSGGAGNDSLYGGADNDVLFGGAGADRLDGGSGTDTADYLASGAGVTVNLATGVVSGGDAAGDTLSGIENVTGSAYSDSLTGDAGANLLDGGAGNDTLAGGAGADSLVGGSGTDTADYLASGAGVTVNLGTGSASGGDAAGDTLSGIENLAGSSHNDSLTGTSTTNVLSGGSGSDSLYGGGGSDTLVGGSGSDLLDGGTGADRADYSASGSGVTVNLATGVASGGDAAGDTLVGIENLTGSSFADSLTGGSSGNVLDSGAGNDTLAGGAGNDTFTGGLGRDTIELGPSGGADRITDFNTSLTGSQTEDQLDVSDLTNLDGSAVKSFDVAVSDDGGGNALLTFPGGETVVLVGVSPTTAATPGMLNQMGVPCFAGGTRILTPHGARRVEDIAPGDLVTLADGGAAPVLWHGTRALSATDLTDLPHLRPIRLKAGRFGLTRDLVVSPQHGLRVAGGLVRARHLAALRRGARVARGIRSVIYHHLLLPRHALIVAEGAATESFYPGPQAVAALSPADRISLAAALGLDPTAAVAPARITATYGPRCLPLHNWTEVLALCGHPAEHQIRQRAA